MSPEIDGSSTPSTESENLQAQVLRAQFPILNNISSEISTLHYLDNAASAQMPACVLNAIIHFEENNRANVKRGAHRLAEMASFAYEEARIKVAAYLGADSADEIIFTSGTTASINLLAWSYGALLQPGDEVVLSTLEHHSNILPWQQLRDRIGIRLRVLPVTQEGRLDLTALPEVIGPRCRLIAIAHISNVTGAISDIPHLVAAAQSVDAKLFLDGAQCAPHGPLDVKQLGCDFYAFSGHKCFGPNGIGVLWGRMQLLEAMPPFLTGGSMIRSVSLTEAIWAPPPTRFEAGTPAIAQAVGLGAALHWATEVDWVKATAHETRLIKKLLSGLISIPGLQIVGPVDTKDRIGVVSFSVAGAHAHDICQILDDHGIALRGGHHCAQPLIEHFNLISTSRASFAPYTIEADIEALLNGLDKALTILR